MYTQIEENREVYEISEDTVENFDQLNEIYRNDTSWIVNKN